MRQSTVYRSLHYTQTLGGADRAMGILNAIFAVAVCFASRTFYYVVVAVLVHLLLVWMTKRDPQWRNVYIAYNRHGDRYDPGVRARVSARGQRPYGFGRSWPC